MDGAETVFVYDFDGNLVAESSIAGTISSEYLYMGSNRLAMADVSSGNLYYYNNNYLGTPLLMTDSNGNVVWDADYQPFGGADVNTNSSVVNNFRFAGQYFDEETGLHYNYFRYYDPKTGRYLTPDPIGLLGGINLFAFASNNPINRTDPFGLADSGMALWGNLTPGQTPDWIAPLQPITVNPVKSIVALGNAANAGRLYLLVVLLKLLLQERWPRQA